MLFRSRGRARALPTVSQMQVATVDNGIRSLLHSATQGCLPQTLLYVFRILTSLRACIIRDFYRLHFPGYLQHLYPSQGGQFDQRTRNGTIQIGMIIINSGIFQTFQPSAVRQEIKWVVRQVATDDSRGRPALKQDTGKQNVMIPSDHAVLTPRQ